MSSIETPPRTEIGHWPVGVSGNPGGYSKEKRALVARISELARQHTEAALKTIVDIMGDEKASRNTRMAAANALLDRGYGKPPQSVGLDFGVMGDDGEETPTFEIARRIAFALQQGANALEEKQQERATATDAELIGATHGDG